MRTKTIRIELERGDEIRLESKESPFIFDIYSHGVIHISKATAGVTIQPRHNGKYGIEILQFKEKC
jgi:hypothetical protein